MQKKKRNGSSLPLAFKHEQEQRKGGNCFLVQKVLFWVGYRGSCCCYKEKNNKLLPNPMLILETVWVVVVELQLRAFSLSFFFFSNDLFWGLKMAMCEAIVICFFYMDHTLISG